ncbi:TetR/AcrR family transcriptional regulator [Nocardioides sp. Bht2]|uniref:TetR/AcrR family transcriptional regulator n=1 Tax=Nocardioides sp. Bht2 TaxID=3392297 RepID=UPI0039B384D5
MSESDSPRLDGRRSAAATRRRKREREILDATRSLFDTRSVRDVHIDDIAKAVGTNRAIIYRHFSGKEELFALTLVGYLDELHALMEAHTDPDPEVRLARVVETFVDFGVRFPAFVECAQALMRQPGPQLFDEISESALFRLGRAIASCLSLLSAILDEGVAKGIFKIGDTAMLANHMYATGLGALQLARVGLFIKELAPGIPTTEKVSVAQVRSYLVDTSLALARG